MKRQTIAWAAGSIVGASIASLFAYRLVIRPWHLRWGATDEETMQALPGDDVVPHPTLMATRAVTVQATPEEIWPWLAQIGKDRAGFYSYDWIENLMGLGIKSSDRIMPEFQELKAGDMLPGLGPVTALEPRRYLLLATHENWGEVSWVIALQPLDAQHTRLITRTRYNLRWGTMMRMLPPQMVPFYLFFEPGEFVMLRRMLLGIKRRAETLAVQKHSQAGGSVAAQEVAHEGVRATTETKTAAG